MAKNPPFSPEEIQKEFEDFVKQRFGDQVQVVAQHVGANKDELAEDEVAIDVETEVDDRDTKSKILDFRYKPHEIKEHLDRFVIKQDDAKKALAIAVCDHYNHVRACHKNPKLAESEYSKQNVMLLGPTGVGKTYLIKQVAKLIGVPFVKADATRFSETGYVGANVDDLIHDLVTQADGDLEMAQFGIVYLDEGDKLAAPSSFLGKDVSGRGVQFGLLKLMEETEVDLRSGNDMRSQMQAFMEFQQKGKLKPRIINTRHILFIISGAFTGLVDLIKERMNENAIGFGSPKDSLDDEEFFKFAQTKDFIDFGFEPEFVGRLPIRVACHHLNEKDLYSILKESEGSIIHQYRQAFKGYGIKLKFENAALKRIAEIAKGEKTGARSLMTVCERTLRNFKFELPTFEAKELVVTRELVDDPESVLRDMLTKLDKKAQHPLADEVERFADGFFQAHNMRLRFSGDAIEWVCKQADKKKKSIDQFLSEKLNGFEHGLKLIQQNTTQTEFRFETKDLKEAQKVLEKWIKESYSKKNKKVEEPKVLH